MERTRTVRSSNGEAKKGQLLHVFSELTNRLALSAQMGFQYRGDRDLYQALGYPLQASLGYDQYYSRYLRQDMAKAIIDRPVKASWKGDLSIIENISPTHTPFEKAWIELTDRLKLKSIFIRADKLTGIGEYSVILLGLNDVRSNEDFARPVTKNSKGLKLLYTKPMGQATASIDKFEESISSERYGLPLLYKVKTSIPDTLKGHKQMDITVHYSRIVHLVEDVLEDEVYGTPRLQAVYNRLMDLEKIVGGDAEMFWRGARPGYTGKLDPDFQITTEGMEDLQDQIDEFEHNLRRILINEGVDYKALDQQIADPASHVEVQMQMISAVTGIPKRILTGSERGELSSAQDKQEWVSYVTSRREEQNEPMILRPFIDRCIEVGILPKPKESKYTVIWDKLFSLSDMDKVNMGKARATALKEYSMNPVAQELMPFNLFCEFFLNMGKTEIDRTMDENDNTVKVEAPVTDDENATLRGEDKDKDSKKVRGEGDLQYGRQKTS
jgi:uncharacterized protein